jgi:hypothetical protein
MLALCSAEASGAVPPRSGPGGGRGGCWSRSSATLLIRPTLPPPTAAAVLQQHGALPCTARTRRRGRRGWGRPAMHPVMMARGPQLPDLAADLAAAVMCSSEAVFTQAAAIQQPLVRRRVQQADICRQRCRACASHVVLALHSWQAIAVSGAGHQPRFIASGGPGGALPVGPPAVVALERQLGAIAVCPSGRANTGSSMSMATHADVPVLAPLARQGGVGKLGGRVDVGGLDYRRRRLLALIAAGRSSAPRTVVDGRSGPWQPFDSHSAQSVRPALGCSMNRKLMDSRAVGLHHNCVSPPDAATSLRSLNSGEMVRRLRWRSGMRAVVVGRTGSRLPQVAPSMNDLCANATSTGPEKSRLRASDSHVAGGWNLGPADAPGAAASAAVVRTLHRPRRRVKAARARAPTATAGCTAPPAPRAARRAAEQRGGGGAGGTRGGRGARFGASTPLRLAVLRQWRRRCA